MVKSVNPIYLFLEDRLFFGGNNLANKKQQKEAKRRALDKARRNKKSRGQNRERNLGLFGEEHSRLNKGSKKTGERGSGNRPRK
ncbi:hypothetical protein HC864_00370 [Candidatus Gracilibacteria bacterium]|nr:hypothetical protein [Candidatus Gracilibacteria bacterium]